MRIAKTLSLLCIAVSLLLTAGTLTAAPDQPLPGQAYQPMTEDGAWCWFSDPRAVYKDGKAYAGWVTKDGSIVVGTYDYKTGETQQTVLHEKFQADDHCNPSILIRPDNRLVVFYTLHGGRNMYIRISENPLDISEWSPVINPGFSNAKNRYGVCYSNPVQLSQEDNKMYVLWRGIDWKPTMSTSTDGGKTWAKPTQVITSTGGRPYVKVGTNHNDRFDIAFTTGHPRREPQNSVFFMRYRDGAFYKADGTKIANIDQTPIAHTDADIVYDATETNVRAWVWDTAADADGNPVIVYTRLPSETDHRYHYARWTGEKWLDVELCKAGKWFPETPQGKREPEPHYSAGIILDHNDPSTVYLALPRGGTFEIEKWTTADKGETWNRTAVTVNSTNDNVRPFVIRDYPAQTEGPRVLWMNNRKYVHFARNGGYDTSIRMDVPPRPLSTAIEPAEIEKAMAKVADWQLENPLRHSKTNWTTGALTAGMSAWAQMAETDKYTDWLIELGNDTNWQLGHRKYHADDHAIGQMYIELFERLKDPEMIAHTKQRLDWVIKNRSYADLKFSRKSQERYSWCDALFMAPPTLARLSAVTGDDKYIDFMDEEWWATTDYLYDEEEHLYFRDSRYFDRREANNEKIFWGRGNGWVFGGICRVLDYMPQDYPTRDKYIKLYKEMAAKLADIQQPDGLWRASLLDPGSYPAPETSSSGFFTYGLAWGINRGILDEDEYLPVVKKAWAGLVKSIHADGKLGYVQPIGADPKKVTFEMTEIYGVGAFLLAGSEVYTIASVHTAGDLLTVANPITTFRDSQTIELPLDKYGNDLAVFNFDTKDFEVTQTVDDDTLLFQADLAPGERKIFRVVPQKDSYDIPESEYTTFGRFVPERKDDFAWENDRIGFRMYGPALAATGEVSSGVDVWAKSVRYPVINKWYEHGHYHDNTGEGLDFYKVGPSLGCGGIGIYTDDKLYKSSNYTDYKVITNGPIRTTFELTFAPWDAAGTEVSETKRISIDLGSNVSRFESTFDIAGSNELPVAIGIVKREDGGDLAYNLAEGWMTYWQPPHAAHGTIGCGVVVPDADVNFVDDHGHGLLVTPVTDGQTITYYAGAGWDQSNDFDTRAQWDKYVKTFAKNKANPPKASKGWK
ncbi:Unsaturated rhamnogalacturonyl hydrolase YteR [Anaerohalosphaera lusitana]|uniref:Unsaturated rhamnogalacturonyl hydrolase YteR n=1 Tax=Anaerohalosphaera lusitana TaxID=1936003 RepID=A0A1U9NQ98_9BACT|nr:glycoside hydrolase family 88 protein [Anaerohalosphaera lusitana]AQT69995.1 Unsaturated rhamnogalacturonyl hydrolase YteR [Anaerohalosphaera lusitana]